MLNLAILIVIIGLIYWLLRLRRRGFHKRLPKEREVINRITGEEVQVFLDYNTPIEHLAFDGIRFGQQFRYKSLSDLGLPQNCDFSIKPVFYSSDTFFQKGSPDERHDYNALGTITIQEAKLLKKCLQMVNTPHNDKILSEITDKLGSDSIDAVFAEKLKKLLKKAQQQCNQYVNCSRAQDSHTSTDQ
jgi:hypothetical protein